MKHMHRGVSLFAGGFIALAAITRLSLRLYNSHMLIDYTFWYLLYLAVPQVINLAIAAVMLRGRRGIVAGSAMTLGGLYVAFGSALIVSLVNSTNEVFTLGGTSLFFRIFAAVFYLLVAVDCFCGDRKWSKWLRSILIILPLARFAAIIATDVCSFSAIVGANATLGLLLRSLWQGFPGLVTELIAEFSIALSLYLSGKTAK
jgi:hypothetical protein